MKKFVISLVLGLLGVLSLEAAGRSRVGVEIGNYPYDPYYGRDVVWEGPGMYWGVWIGNRRDFYEIRRHRRYYYKRHHHYYHRYHNGRIHPRHR